MVKVETDPKLSNALSFNSLEINKTRYIDMVSIETFKLDLFALWTTWIIVNGKSFCLADKLHASGLLHFFMLLHQYCQ